MTDVIAFADWLNEKLREHDLSQAGLARKAGLHKSVINKLSRSIVIKPDAITCVAHFNASISRLYPEFDALSNAALEGLNTSEGDIEPIVNTIVNASTKVSL